MTLFATLLNEWHKEEHDNLKRDLGFAVRSLTGADKPPRQSKDHELHGEFVRLCLVQGTSYPKVELKLGVNRGTIHKEAKKHEAKMCGCFS